MTTEEEEEEEEYDDDDDDDDDDEMTTEKEKEEEEEDRDNELVGSDEKHKMHFIIHNVSKKHNVGTICRNCTAFDVKKMHLVGNARFNVFGAQGSDVHVAIEHHESLKKARESLYQNEKCDRILGIEICEGAIDVRSHPFTGNTAFVLGNEGHGMTAQQKEICDGFVYIKQFGRGTASLNVAVASSIVMHEFAKWAEYEETAREGEKFIVASRPRRRGKKGIASGSNYSEDSVRKARELRKMEMDEDDDYVHDVDGSFYS